jgi:hypothetical protein
LKQKEDNGFGAYPILRQPLTMALAAAMAVLLCGFIFEEFTKQRPPVFYANQGFMNVGNGDVRVSFFRTADVRYALAAEQYSVGYAVDRQRVFKAVLVLCCVLGIFLKYLKDTVIGCMTLIIYKGK